MRPGFSVGYRNPGHWDICTDDGRAFRIRGEPGNVWVHDERTRDGQSLRFKTVTAAMAWCADELMAERRVPA